MCRLWGRAANCRGKVEAAFERRRTSGRTYRKEMISIVSDHQTLHETAEFLPPDRMREITNDVEIIRIGPRAWSSEGGWHEWEPGLAELIYGAGMDFSLLPDRAVPLVPVFECLGTIEFKGKAYIGFRARPQKGSYVVLAPLGSRSQEEEQKLLSKLRQMPQQLRTVFVEWPSMLPAYDLVAEENQLDNLRSGVHYTYPDNIRVEPPL